jgi:MoaA/NifB/PqqE/SkfB family radical SAM enzyme
VTTPSQNKKKPYLWTKPFSFFEPRFDWIQVEITSDCQAACIYCPRTAYRDCWPNQYLPLDSFKKLEPAFAHSRMVHLQGWGEPFLHPDFFSMAAIAKAAGCRVGTTTNGMLLKPDLITRIVTVPLDTLAFSLAGTDSNNDKIRKGTNLRIVLETIRAVDREKKRVNSQKPFIHIAYMLFRSRIEDLDQLPSLLQGQGIDQVVISTLDFVSEPDLEFEIIRPTPTEEYKNLEQRLQDVVQAGLKKGLPIHFNLPSAQGRRRECTENVGRALCVASDGSVTPCVFTNLQIPGGEYLHQGKIKCYERLVFGNINLESLTDIWRKKDYRYFRGSFRHHHLASPCQGCPKF